MQEAKLKSKSKCFFAVKLLSKQELINNEKTGFNPKEIDLMNSENYASITSEFV